MKSVWDKLAKKYDDLWVQKYSLSPTREAVLKYIEKLYKKEDSFKMLDAGCATAELLNVVYKKYEKAHFFGIDKSSEMIKIAIDKNDRINFRVCDVHDYENLEKFDIITCCHSFPYYNDKEKVLEKFSKLTNKNGKIIFVQASKNSIYDKIVMFFVEFTAEKADYLSKKDFLKMSEKHFDTVDVFLIKKKMFMPSIYGFVLEPKNENIVN